MVAIIVKQATSRRAVLMSGNLRKNKVKENMEVITSMTTATIPDIFNQFIFFIAYGFYLFNGKNNFNNRTHN